MISLQYPCHPRMGKQWRTRFYRRRKDGKPWRSQCKLCSRIWSFRLSPDGPVIEEVAR